MGHTSWKPDEFKTSRMHHHALLFRVVVLIAGVLGLGFLTASVALMAKSCFPSRSQAGKMVSGLNPRRNGRSRR